MKKHIIFIASLLLAGLTGCNEDPNVEVFESYGTQSLIANLPTTEATHVEITDGESSVSLSWESEDQFSVYTTTGDYVTDFKYSTIDSSDNTTVFTAVEGGTALVDGVSYTAIFPSVEGMTSLDDHRTAIESKVATQTQDGNNSKTHFNDHLLMEAEFTFSATNNTAITFEHKMAALRLTFAAPDGCTPTKLIFDDGTFASYTLNFTNITEADSYTANYVILPNEAGTMRELKATIYATSTGGTEMASDFSIESEAKYSAGVQYRSELSIADVDVRMEISTLSELIAFRDAVNSGSTALNAKLLDNINLEGSETNQWTPIASFDSRYSGTFDGNGKTISGLYINTTLAGSALFGALDGATVKNLTVEGSVTSTSGESTAAFAGYAYSSTISNCSTTAATTINGVGNNTAGIVAYISATTLDNCTNNATIIGSRYVGGLAAFTATTKTYISNSTNYGSVSDDNATDSKSDYVGGLVGKMYGTTSSITNSANHGNVSCSHDYSGGIAGYCDYSTIDNCYNTADVKGAKYCGGIAGQLYSATVYGSAIVNSYNTGYVYTGESDNQYYVGGIAGLAYASKIANCYNLGKVGSSANRVVGGLVGWNWTSATITACYSAAEVTSGYSYSALVNTNSSTCSITFCYSNSDLCSASLVSTDDSSTTFAESFDTAYMQSEAFVETMNDAAYHYNLTSPDVKAYGWALNSGGYPVLDSTVTPTERVIAPISISSAEELAKIGVDATYSIYDSYILTGDIDLNDVSWSPLAEFKGTFDGDNHTISGLNIDTNHGSIYDYGLFKIVSYGGSVKNLTVEGKINVTTTGLQAVGMISGYLNQSASMENCHVKGSITADESHYIGGVTGYANNSSTITNCTSEVTISTTNSYTIGGVVGYLSGSSTVDYCRSSATITNSGTVDDTTDYKARVGGVVGYVKSSAVVINSSNSGSLSSDFKHTGGIAGRSESGAYIYNCYNTGSVYSYARSGGISGCNVSSTIDNCINTGAITSDTSYSISNENGYDYSNLHGGIIGETWNVQYVQNSYFLSSSVDPSEGVGMDQYTNLYSSKGWDGYLTTSSVDDLNTTEMVSTLNTNASAITNAKSWVVGTNGTPVFAE